MAPAEAASLLAIPAIVTQCLATRDRAALGTLVRRFWPLLAGICAGTVIAAWLSAISLLVARVRRWGRRLCSMRRGRAGPRATARAGPRLEPVLAPLIGTASGLVTAATGVFVVPAVPFSPGARSGQGGFGASARLVLHGYPALVLGAVLAVQGTLGRRRGRHLLVGAAAGAARHGVRAMGLCPRAAGRVPALLFYRDAGAWPRSALR
ncbi:MAG: hypothetical protein WDN69_19130 [Aliidongia sp.]